MVMVLVATELARLFRPSFMFNHAMRPPVFRRRRVGMGRSPSSHRGSVSHGAGRLRGRWGGAGLLTRALGPNRGSSAMVPAGLCGN